MKKCVTFLCPNCINLEAYRADCSVCKSVGWLRDKKEEHECVFVLSKGGLNALAPYYYCIHCFNSKKEEDLHE